jgi:hypothetical protein
MINQWSVVHIDIAYLHQQLYTFRTIVGHFVSYNFAATMHSLAVALTILDYICLQYSMVYFINIT